MHRVNFDYSTKNIPTASHTNYKKRLIEKTELFLRRIRWKAFFYLNPLPSTRAPNTYGFNTRQTPPVVSELKVFENRLLNLIQNIEFQTVSDHFQTQLRKDTRAIRNDSNIYVKADKTTNFYKMDKNGYNDLLNKNINKNYKKADKLLEHSIHNQARSIARSIELGDRINSMAKKEAFLTLKDHKPNFANNPTCRLINPAKSELGHVSKVILERINKSLIKQNNINMWGNTTSVLSWFRDIKNKVNSHFICFDVVEFYPSITEFTLNAALDYAEGFVDISGTERDIIMHTKKSLLFSDEQPWSKRSSVKSFDVAMGSFDGAETCELVGCFILSQLNAKYGNSIGLYRDDGLAVFDKPPRDIECIKKDLCTTFNKYDLKITIEANKKIVDFLDVTLDLDNNTYRPYNKPNNVPLYVHCKSNHPPSIIKNIPASINRRLSEISSDEQVFNQAAPVYQNALRKSGYNYELKYQPSVQGNRHRCRHRKVTWYNPPFDLTVKTDIGRAFLKILKESFGENNPLKNIFNKNTVKLSYSCMPNFKNILDGHNKFISGWRGEDINNNKNCNCRNKAECPLEGNCQVSSVVYQAKVTTNNSVETYVGLTENTFKTRYNNHKTSFNNANKKLATELSKYLWKLKDSNSDFDLKWSVLKQAKAYDAKSKRCDLCISEKYFIICKPELSSLNKRNELVSACRHSRKFLLGVQSKVT